MNSSFLENPTEELQIAGYVMLSRAKFLEKIWIMQAFSRGLFTQGPPMGPHLLMRKLKGEITADAVADEWAKAEESARKREKGDEPMKRLFRCTQCWLSGRKDFMKPPPSFGVYASSDILAGIVAHGAWTRCLPCRELAAQCRQRAGFPSDVAEVITPTIGADTGMACSKCGLV